MTDRQCGQCDECCTLLAVDEINKPTDTRCPHLVKAFQGGGKCSIYETRPSECMKFVCGWLGGIVPSKYRPDRVGIVVYFRDSEEGPGICLAETRAGALDSAAGRQLAARVRQQGRRLILRPKPDA